MTTLETPVAALNPSSPVPLDTIPISPAKEAESRATNGGSTQGDVRDSEEQITVFHDKDNFNVKHPLMNEWTLWFTKPPSGKVRYYTTHLAFGVVADCLQGSQLERFAERSCHL